MRHCDWGEGGVEHQVDHSGVNICGTGKQDVGIILRCRKSFWSLNFLSGTSGANQEWAIAEHNPMFSIW